MPSPLRSSEQNAIRAAMASMRAAQPGGPVVDGDGAGVGVVGPEQQPGQLGAPGARAARPARAPRRGARRGRPARSRPCGPARTRPAPGVGQLRRCRSGGWRSRSVSAASSWPTIFVDHLQPRELGERVLADQPAVAQDRRRGRRSRRPGRGSARRRAPRPRRRGCRGSPGTARAPRRRRGWTWARRGSARRASRSTALAMATSCWTASGWPPSTESGSTARLSRASSSAARRRTARRSMRPSRRGSRPSRMFSATVRLGQRLTSW